MIKGIFFNLAVLIVVICHGAELNTNEAEAEIFLNKTSEKLFKISDKAEEGKSTINHNIDEDSALEESKSLKKIIKDSKKFDFDNFKDEGLKYAFKILIQVADLKIIKQKRFLDLFHSLDDLEDLLENEHIKAFDDSRYGLPYFTQIKNIIRTTHDIKELEYFWIEWRKITEEWANDYLDDTLNALKSAAGFNKLSPLEFWLRGFNITDMENLMTEIQPIYKELHGFIRNLLQKKYGESIIGADGLIPDHVFEQVLFQIGTNMSIIEEMFPFDSLPPVESVMKEKLQPKQLYEIAEGFYGDLGFEKFPTNIWGDRIKVKKSEFDDDDDEDSEEYEDEEDSDSNEHLKNETHNDDDEEESEEHGVSRYGVVLDYDCYPILSYSTPNIRLEFCNKVKLKEFLNAYAIMGYLHYAKEMVGLPAYFFKPPHGLEYAIGKAAILSASSHHNLKAIGIITDFEITPKVEMNRLLRMAITSLLNIPFDFVHIKCMADLVSGKVKKPELNNHYWNLMDKYAGVGQPKQNVSSSSSSNLYLPFNFYKRMTQNDMSRDFTSEILSYQLHKKLCEISGNYPKEELHLCDINGSKEAGNAFKKMMQLGNSKPFNEVLATMFPENPTVRTDGILEYYNPIKKFIMEKNKEANVSLGWKNIKSA